MQLQEGIRFFSRKYSKMDYLAYFQAYTNTYETLEHLKSLYEEALQVPGIKGLVIGTRPDCMTEDLLDYLEYLSKNKFLLIEYGLESTKDETLVLINRGHDFACSQDAVRRTAKRGLFTGAHLILGLPGESREDILHHADLLNSLPLDTLKLHQLQIIRGTKLASQMEVHPEMIHLYGAEEYAGLVIDFIERLRPDIAVERFVSQSPSELLIAPDWGLKNYEFIHLVEKKMKAQGSYQGRLYNTKQ